MAIATPSMNNSNKDEDEDHREHDMVMPGFRFHPTERELVEFYLRRKVEGERFNVELITFLDLYRYDPWELPALAAIGEKEWFFYVPRDRKYRNGDRPNRVTTSGYWKATGADRMIKSESSRSIGLKKTLVFYSGKAPKGIRISWIMNEYRLPHLKLNDTKRQKYHCVACTRELELKTIPLFFVHFQREPHLHHHQGALRHHRMHILKSSSTFSNGEDVPDFRKPITKFTAKPLPSNNGAGSNQHRWLVP